MKNKQKNRANKINLVFDEDKRREFLTGFHKRKLQRKKEAKDKLEQELKEERRRLKAEAKESYKKLVKSYQPLPELEDLLKNQYEDQNVTVKVLELSTNDIAKQNHWIGANQPVYEDDDNVSVKIEDVKEEEEVPGMELYKKPTVKSVKKEITTKTKKDLKKLLKKQATKKVQKSKVFQMKNKVEKQKQRKKSRKDKELQEKKQFKKNRHKKSNTRKQKT